MSPALTCFVEIPMGSRNKYEWDADLGGIKLDRFLFSSIGYPADYGFIPDTVGANGDPLDALVCVTEPTFPGCVIPVRAIGLLRASDDRGRDDKVICVPESDPAWNDLSELDDLPQQLKTEIHHFFSIYKQPEEREVAIEGWASREEALASIDEGRERFGAY